LVRAPQIITESSVRFDAKANALCFVFEEAKIARAIEVSTGIAVEFGVEVLRASHVLTEKVIASLHAKHRGAVKNDWEARVRDAR
jgi:hypothetical protein